MDDLTILVLGYLAFKALSEYQDSIVPNMQQKGADLFEQLHPQQQGHANDLPGKQWTRAQIRELVDRHQFAQPEIAVAIALAESGGVPNALGDIRDGVPISIGLWQINYRAHPSWTREQLVDPEQNAAAAFQISKGGTDWRPWSTWWQNASARQGPGQGRYLKYMKG